MGTARSSDRLFEHRDAPLLSRRAFAGRVVRSALVFLVLVGGSLAIGAAGYHWIGGLLWIDAFLNAAMILTGMGPVDRMTETAPKIFAIGYSLFSGVAFLTAVGILGAPIVHRFLHRFHLEEEAEVREA